MTQLNQIVAIENTAAKAAEDERTNAYHTLQKDAIFGGISRVYDPIDDDGDKLPPESVKVIANAESLLNDFATATTRFFDLRLTKEAANQIAEADLVVDGITIAKNVPVTYLIQLEKELVHVRTFVSKLPLLDPAENWHADGASGAFVTDEKQTHRTNKIPKAFVAYPATDKHPAQVQVFQEDVITGYWTTKKFSGRVSKQRQTELATRVNKLIEAVKLAREEANRLEVTDRKIGAALFGYVLNGA
jgi:hypothetical protein